MGVGVIISELEPEKNNRYVWMKPKPDGSVEYYELGEGSVWMLKYTAPVFVLPSDLSTHAALPNIHHPANVGVTGIRTVGGFRLTFTSGLLTGFEPA